MYQLFIQLPVRLISHRQIDPRLFIYDTLVMGECIKSCFPVIATHAALAESSEWHLACSQMNDSVVDASSAESASGCNLLSGVAVICEDIEREWMWHSVNVADDFIQRIVGQ